MISTSNTTLIRVKSVTAALATCIAVIVVTTMTGSAQQNMPKTTKESVRGEAKVTTEQLRGTVVYVSGNDLVVRMAEGDIREFNVPESRKFMIDGHEMTVHDLKPGTKLEATMTTTMTPVTDRTTTVGSGTVWYIAGNTVILTLPNGENRTYKVKDDYRFVIDGRKTSASELRKGMKVAAEKIVEEPRTEIASDTIVTGQAPPPPTPRAVVAQAPPAAPAPRREVAQARPQQAQPAPAPTPAPAPASEPVQVAQAAPAPERLPATGSQLPLASVLALLLMTFGLGLAGLSRRV